MKNLIFLLLLVCSYQNSIAQFTMQNGHYLPTEGTIRVLFIHVQVDCNPCNTNTNCLNENELGWWLPNQLPDDVDNYIDATLSPGQLPQKPITRYFHEASFGKLTVLGDYYDEILTIPCDQMNGQYSVDVVLDALNDQFAAGNPAFATTKNGLTLQDFDNVSLEGARGIAKPLSSNGVIDVIGIVWRNNGLIGACQNGAAFQPFAPATLNDGTNTFTTSIVASYNDCSPRRKMFLAEFFHALYGGNHWHSGGGFGVHTFPWTPGSIGMSGQANSLSSAVSGWDRWMLGWASNFDNPNNTIVTTALDETNSLVNTELQMPNANEQVYILRDHITTGDALKITLPHFNWQSSGDIKNQYLWIENRQLLSEFEVQQYAPSQLPCSDDFEVWQPGIYASMVVGKDQLSSSFQGELFDDNCDNANGCGSHQFPLSAEGNYDYEYRFDLEINGNPNWCAGPRYIPKDKNHPNTLPNPFIGASDLYATQLDYNGDGQIIGLETGIDIGNAEVLNDEVVLNLNRHGDGEDAFQLNGNNKIGIGTNPASTPLYTLRSGSLSGPQTYDNRTIYLNGISVEIIEEIWNENLQAYDLKVKVRWDDYLIDQNQRWCGNIVSQDDPNDTWQSQVIIGEGKTLTLDQSRTPTRYIGITQPNGNLLLTEPTELRISTNTKLHLLDQSNLTIKSGSKLIIEDGAEVILEEGACIVVEEDGFLELQGNDIRLNGANALISVRGTLITSDNVDFTFVGDGYADFYENHVLELGINSNFILQRNETDPGYGERFILLQNNTTLSVDDRLIELQGGTVFYESNAEFTAVNSEIVFTDVTFSDLDGGSPTSDNSSFGFDGLKLTSCTIDNCTFEYFDQALRITGNTTLPVISDSKFSRNNKGVDIQSMDEVTFTNNTITFNGIEGIHINLVDVVNFNGNWIEDNPLGIMLDQVNFAYLAGTHISNSTDKALHAHESNVFLNDGGAIFDSNIGAFFSKSSATLSNFLLSVGKCNCGKIINNNVGVQGEDVILDIDGIEHSFECTPALISANRFDGNTTIFDICYSGLFPNPILMRGNYWGGQAIGNNYSIVYGNTNIACGAGNVSVDAAPFASSFDDCGELSGLIDPNDPTGDPTHVSCEFTSGGTLVEVHEQSRQAFNDIYQKDFQNAKTKYTPIANLDSGIHTDATCLNKIYIARCIVNAIDNDQHSSARSDWVQSAIRVNPFEKDHIAIYPNPAQSMFTIETMAKEIHFVRIYNLYGQVIETFEFEKKKEVYVEYLPKGIYIIELSHAGQTEPLVRKVLVE